MAQQNYGSNNSDNFGTPENVIADLMKEGTDLFNKVRDMDLDWKTLAGALAAIGVVGGLAVYFFSDKDKKASSILGGLQQLTSKNKKTQNQGSRRRAQA